MQKVYLTLQSLEEGNAVTTGTLLRSLEIKVENTWYLFSDLLPLFKNVQAWAQNISATIIGKFGFYVDAPFSIQQARLTDDNGSPAILDVPIQIITDDKISYIKNIVASTVNKFVGGKNYLVNLNQSQVIVDIIPATTVVPFAVIFGGTVEGLTNNYSSRKFSYTAATDLDIRSGQTLSVISYDVDYPELIRSQNLRAERKMVEGEQLVQSLTK